MRHLILPALTLFAALGLPAAADPMGGVARVVLGHAIFAEGAAARDGLAQIAGARLAVGVTLQLTPRDAETEGKAPEGAGSAKAPRDALSLLTEAEAAVAADETLSFLLASTKSTADVLPKVTVKSTPAQIAPGQKQHFKLATDGGAALDLGLIGDGSGLLTLSVTADKAELCRTTGLPLCLVTLPDSGFVTVTVENPGTEAENYLLITN